MNSFERFASGAINLFLASLPQYPPSDDVLRATKLVAHRGVHESNLAIENTLPAFQLAIDNHIWGIEFDIRMTSDLVPIVHHDPSCERLFDRPDIQINQIHFKDLRTAIPQIPTLKEVIDLASHKTHLLIEIKEDYRGRSELINILKNHLQHLEPLTDYHLISLEPEYLEAFDFCTQKAKLDVYWMNKNKILMQNKQLGHGALAGYFLFLSTQDIKTLHLDQKTVGVGFIDSKNSLYRELNRGVDYIFTNHALKLKKYLS